MVLLLKRLGTVGYYEFIKKSQEEDRGTKLIAAKEETFFYIETLWFIHKGRMQVLCSARYGEVGARVAGQ